MSALMRDYVMATEGARTDGDTVTVRLGRLAYSDLDCLLSWCVQASQRVEEPDVRAYILAQVVRIEDALRGTDGAQRTVDHVLHKAAFWGHEMCPQPCMTARAPAGLPSRTWSWFCLYCGGTLRACGAYAQEDTVCERLERQCPAWKRYADWVSQVVGEWDFAGDEV